MTNTDPEIVAIIETRDSDGVWTVHGEYSSHFAANGAWMRLELVDPGHRTPRRMMCVAR